MWEWNFDWSAGYPSSCNDCANVTPADYRARRGGSFEYYAYGMRGDFRFEGGPTYRYYDVGARCARTP